MQRSCSETSSRWLKYAGADLLENNFSTSLGSKNQVLANHLPCRIQGNETGNEWNTDCSNTSQGNGELFFIRHFVSVSVEMSEQDAGERIMQAVLLKEHCTASHVWKNSSGSESLVKDLRSWSPSKIPIWRRVDTRVEVGPTIDLGAKAKADETKAMQTSKREALTTVDFMVLFCLVSVLVVL